jgi:hypothetical protein
MELVAQKTFRVQCGHDVKTLIFLERDSEVARKVAQEELLII